MSDKLATVGVFVLVALVTIGCISIFVSIVKAGIAKQEECDTYGDRPITEVPAKCYDYFAPDPPAIQPVYDLSN